MERTLERGEEKIQKICEALRKETLQPAMEEAERVIAEAKLRSEQIIHEARREAEKILNHAKDNIEQERNVFYSSLEQAAKQSIEELRQTIENKLFNDELEQIVAKHLRDPKLIARLIDAIVNAIEKEGIKTNIAAVISETVKPEEVNSLLAENVLKKLKDQSVATGAITGGAQIKLLDRKMTIEITDQSLIDLLSRYLRKDYRKMLFGN